VLVVSPREPQQIQREIEASRAQLAATLDQLVERVSPKRLADQARDTTLAFLQTPPGMALAGGLALLLALGIARRVRSS
jgi:hypothetical protein